MILKVPSNPNHSMILYVCIYVHTYVCLPTFTQVARRGCGGCVDIYIYICSYQHTYVYSHIYVYIYEMYVKYLDMLYIINIPLSDIIVNIYNNYKTLYVTVIYVIQYARSNDIL